MSNNNNNNKSAAASAASAPAEWTSEALERLYRAITRRRVYTVGKMNKDLQTFMSPSLRKEVMRVLGRSSAWRGARPRERALDVLGRVLKNTRSARVRWAVGEVLDLLQPISEVSWRALLGLVGGKYQKASRVCGAIQHWLEHAPEEVGMVRGSTFFRLEHQILRAIFEGRQEEARLDLAEDYPQLHRLLTEAITPR